MKLIIQLISIYRAIAMFIFILYFEMNSNIFNTILVTTAISSDLLDGYLAKKHHLTTVGGQLLDLFSDKYLNIIFVIYLIVMNNPLLPLILIISKEIFVLSFRSIKINGQFVISTNRTIGGIFSASLFFVVLLQINNLFLAHIYFLIYILGVANAIYLLYKIASNFGNLKKIFQTSK